MTAVHDPSLKQNMNLCLCIKLCPGNLHSASKSPIMQGHWQSPLQKSLPDFNQVCAVEMELCCGLA